MAAEVVGGQVGKRDDLEAETIDPEGRSTRRVSMESGMVMTPLSEDERRRLTALPGPVDNGSTPLAMCDN
jgi:hypothetical protein